MLSLPIQHKIIGSNMKNLLKEIGLTLTFQEIQIMKVQTYQNIGETQIHSAAFKYLKGKVKSKGNKINYGGQLSCQYYLLPKKM